jgi:hypothetical protein
VSRVREDFFSRMHSGVNGTLVSTIKEKSLVG